MDIEHLHTIRSAELDDILAALAEFTRNFTGGDISILEIGGGTGWQAKQLSERGYNVETIDIETSNLKDDQVWPITIYDGKNIPFPDRHFDVLLSSNVLEHIPHLTEFHTEMHRILRPNGISIHIVPSGSWRLWTNAGHYPLLLRMIVQKIFSKGTQTHADLRDDSERGQTLSRQRISIGKKIRAVLYPTRHGEVGNALSEVFHFSKIAWTKEFDGNGWEIMRYSGNRLIYTGCFLFGSSLSLKSRRFLSNFLGSSCHIFVLKSNQN